MNESDLVVNWRGARSRGWGGWAEKGGDVEETFRFACPNNPAVREKTMLRLRELLLRYDFKGVFLDKMRFPSPANGTDELLSCFCEPLSAGGQGEGHRPRTRSSGIFADGALITQMPCRSDGSCSVLGSTRSQPQTFRSRGFSPFGPRSVARLVGQLRR